MPESSLLDELNPIQRQAVETTEGPVLILAGAGSGKTKALTHRVAYLISEKHITPENICVLTFTNKSAGEMMDRIIKLIGTKSARPIMGTFHSLCARILRKEGKFIGLPPSFSIYDEGDAIDAIKQAMATLDLSTQKTSPNSVKNTISGAKNEMISSLEYPNYARGFFQETVAKIYLEYQKILEKNQAVDFDDLLLCVVKLFQKHPEILGAYQIQFRYILIDEYQDTNAVQYMLSKMLANRYKNICVVGDAAQSIYRFRGADFRNIVNFKNDYPMAKVFNLEQNYRSTQNILDAAYSVISKNQSHPILKLWTEKEGGEKIEVTETRNENEEALFITKKVRELSLPLSSFAVLYRTNAQSRALEEIFLKVGLPYILVGGTRFYERKEVKDILAYLRLVVNPQDTVSLARIEKIGKGRAAKFWEILNSASYARGDAEEGSHRLARSDEGVRTDDGILQRQDPDAQLTGPRTATLELMDKILEATQYLEYIDDGTDTGKSRVENVKELRSVAEQFPNISEFLENVALVESEYTSDEKHKKRISDEKREAVTLTTLHQAKGLEWPVVFMVGMEEGLFPHSRCLLDPSEMEEERRLCYVGITRAKQKLFLTYARQRLFFGTRSNNLVSRFVIDLPGKLIESNTNYQDQDQFLDDVSLEKDTDDWI